MTIEIFLLVFLSSVLHASWNYLAKTIPSGAPFVWLAAAVMTLVLLPFVVLYLAWYGFAWTPANMGALALTGLLHLVYFLVLQKGYQAGDLSLVYPLARGSGPVFTTFGAVWLLGEQVTAFSILGLLLIVVGVLLVSGIFQSSSDPARRRIGVYYGLATGVLIACYTVWDGYAVKEMAIAPLLLEFSSNPIRLVLLGPMAWNKRLEIRGLWAAHYWKILAISLMAPLGFISVLYAMKVAPVHLVAPTRELSIVLGVLLGAKLLTEENFRMRLAGSVLIVGGIVFLAH